MRCGAPLLTPSLTLPSGDAHVIRNAGRRASEDALRCTPPHPPLTLPSGDAHVIRNAGGRASEDALRSLTISQRLLGTTEIHVIHHTDW